MNNLLDWFFLIVIVMALLRGWKRGFFGGLAGLLGYVVAVWLAVNYHVHIAQTLSDNSDLLQKLNSWLGLTVPAAKGIDSESVMQDAGAVGQVVLYIVSFSGTFIAARFGLALIGKIISSLLKAIPVISLIERFGGLLLGIADGVLIVGLCSLLLALVMPWLPLPQLEQIVSESQFWQALIPYVKHFTPFIVQNWHELPSF